MIALWISSPFLCSLANSSVAQVVLLSHAQLLQPARPWMLVCFTELTLPGRSLKLAVHLSSGWEVLSVAHSECCGASGSLLYAGSTCMAGWLCPCHLLSPSSLSPHVLTLPPKARAPSPLAETASQGTCSPGQVADVAVKRVTAWKG